MGKVLLQLTATEETLSYCCVILHHTVCNRLYDHSALRHLCGLFLFQDIDDDAD